MLRAGVLLEKRLCGLEPVEVLRVLLVGCESQELLAKLVVYTLCGQELVQRLDQLLKVLTKEKMGQRRRVNTRGGKVRAVWPAGGECS